MDSKINTPDLKDIILYSGLYKSLPLKSFNNFTFLNLLFDSSFLRTFTRTLLPEHLRFETLDALNIYCPICNEITTHESSSIVITKTIDELSAFCNEKHLSDTYIHGDPSDVEYHINQIYNLIEDIGSIERKFVCVHSKKERHKHFFSVIYKVEDHSLIKIGQYPSINDITGVELKKYKKIHKDIFTELNKANGLFSHGIGVGSYAYLRRIIEKYIVNEKYTNYLKSTGKTPEESESLTKNAYFKDKVTTLKDELSDLLHGSDKIYGFLSKGIHGLSEDECLEVFPILFDSICIILDEEIERIEKETKKKKLASKLNKL